jgi:hypothetical protein
VPYKDFAVATQALKPVLLVSIYKFYEDQYGCASGKYGLEQNEEMQAGVKSHAGLEEFISLRINDT